ncbi:MAG TPA: hypothetical protein VF778_12160, partial [Xanthobacteraceae bacterium]
MTFPLNPEVGDVYKNWSWNGERWVCLGGGGGGGGGAGGGGVYVSPEPPAGPQAGQLWLNTTDGQLYVYNGSTWLIATGAEAGGGGGVQVGPVAPDNPQPGDFWFNTGNDLLY